MHVLYTDTGIDDIHVLVCHDVGDCSASTDINLTEFTCLIITVIIIHDAADLRHVFRIGII